MVGRRCDGYVAPRRCCPRTEADAPAAGELHRRRRPQVLVAEPRRATVPARVGPVCLRRRLMGTTTRELQTLSIIYIAVSLVGTGGKHAGSGRRPFVPVFLVATLSWQQTLLRSWSESSEARILCHDRQLSGRTVRGTREGADDANDAVEQPPGVSGPEGQELDDGVGQAGLSAAPRRIRRPGVLRLADDDVCQADEAVLVQAEEEPF